jgi:cellulose synthase/poly-beta-1,6-N-acetylglucosamine synthase-like glycosyltransferase
MEPQTLAQQTTVTIGICAVTEIENTLRLTGQILAASDPGLRINELVVATPNRNLARELEGLDKRLVVVLENKRDGKAIAINRIIRKATGDILVLASADIKLGRNSIPRLVQSLVDNDSWGAVDSRVELVNGDERLMDRVGALLWDVHNATLDELDGDDRLGHIAGDLIAVRRDLIDTLPEVINDDAYVALRVQEKGFRVKRVQDAFVWIVGPRNPADYVSQRSRVIQGHLQLVGLFGRMPSTFEFMVVRKPRQYLRLLVHTVTKLGPSHLPALLVGGFLETLSLQLAIVSSLIGCRNQPWRIPETTKRI